MAFTWCRAGAMVTQNAMIGCLVRWSRDQTFFKYYLYKYFGSTEIQYTVAYTTYLQNQSTAIFPTSLYTSIVLTCKISISPLGLTGHSSSTAHSPTNRTRSSREQRPGINIRHSDGIPSAVWDAIGDDKIGKMLCLAMNNYAGGEIFLAYEDQDGRTWSCK